MREIEISYVGGLPKLIVLCTFLHILTYSSMYIVLSRFLCWMKCASKVPHLSYMYTKIDAKNSFKEYNSLGYNQCAGILTRNSI